MPPTSADLERLLASRVARPDGGRSLSAGQLVTVARNEQLLPTLVSAWECEGRPIGQVLAAETQHYRDRLSRYLDLERRLAETLSVRPLVLKGRTIGGHYPRGWIRASADLDLRVDAVGAVVEAGLLLQRTGMVVTKVTLFRESGQLHLCLDVTDPRFTRLGTPDLVQLQDFDHLGDGWSARPTANCPELQGLSSVERSLVEVTAAVARRGMRARDILDFRLLDGHHPSAALAPVLAQLRLWPAWEALTLATSRLWPQPSPFIVRAQGTSRGTGSRLIPLPPSASGTPMASAASILSAGLPLVGRPRPGSPRSGRVRVSVAADGGASFSGPFGSGQLGPVR